MESYPEPSVDALMQTRLASVEEYVERISSEVGAIPSCDEYLANPGETLQRFPAAHIIIELEAAHSYLPVVNRIASTIDRINNQRGYPNTLTGGVIDVATEEFDHLKELNVVTGEKGIDTKAVMGASIVKCEDESIGYIGWVLPLNQLYAQEHMRILMAPQSPSSSDWRQYANLVYSWAKQIMKRSSTQEDPLQVPTPGREEEFFRNFREKLSKNPLE